LDGLLYRTFNKLVCRNVGAFRPRFQRSPTGRADRVTRMRCQELLFSASVLGAAIALNNCRHLGNMRLGPSIFQPGTAQIYNADRTANATASGWRPCQKANGVNQQARGAGYSPALFNLDGGLSTRQVIVEGILPATWQASRLGAQSRRCPAPCQRWSFPKLR
jgi:hypothetical protein